MRIVHDQHLRHQQRSIPQTTKQNKPSKHIRRIHSIRRSFFFSPSGQTRQHTTKKQSHTVGHSPFRDRQTTAITPTMPQSASATSSVAASPPATPTTSSSAGGGLGGGPAPPKTAPPTSIQPTPFARVYASAHPLLLLGLLAWRFPALVADPVAEMTSVVPFLAALQTFFVMTVLPPAGSAPAASTPATATVGKDDRLEEKEKESAVPRSEIIKPNKGPYRRKAPFASSSSSSSPVLAVGRALTTRLTVRSSSPFSLQTSSPRPTKKTETKKKKRDK